MSIRLSRTRLLLLAAALILAGLALAGQAAYQSFTIQVDGQVRQVKGVGSRWGKSCA
jgi:uncharacterized protein YabE (DUF348 family)